MSGLELPSATAPATRRAEFWAGVRAESPMLIGAIPFGMMYGALAVGSGVPPAVAQAMSAIVFAGSSQFLAVQLIAAGAPAVVVLLSAAVINLRHALYSASLAASLGRLPLGWKWLLAYLLTDEAYVVAINRYRSAEASQLTHWYFLGAGGVLWLFWQLSTAAGILLGAQIPPEWSLDFTLVLTFIALVVPGLRGRSELAAALSAGLIAVLAAGLPYKLGLLLGAAGGITVGMLWPQPRRAIQRQEAR